MTEETIVASSPIRITSFEGFYARSWQQVYRAVAMGIGDSDLAKEALDEAMVRAYERWSKVSRMANPEGWVYQVAMNWARSRLRRRRLMPLGRASDDVVHDQEVVDPKLMNAVRNLPFRHREVIVARFLLDMSEAATAREGSFDS
jgi:RNA polymerase sigma-70 factor (ECF subfamily)